MNVVYYVCIYVYTVGVFEHDFAQPAAGEYHRHWQEVSE